MITLKTIICFIIAYVIGSISFSILLSRLFYNGDVREGGSGNAGATNMGRRFGKLAGLLTLVGDILKAVLSMFLGNLLAGEAGLVAAAWGCVIGHCFPAYYKFKGGKGVAVGLAIATAAGWQMCVAAIATFVVVVFLTRKVSLASLCATIAVVISACFFAPDKLMLVMIIVTAAVIIIRHSTNIKRLVQGQEADFTFGNSKKKE